MIPELLETIRSNSTSSDLDRLNQWFISYIETHPLQWKFEQLVELSKAVREALTDER